MKKIKQKDKYILRLSEKVKKVYNVDLCAVLNDIVIYEIMPRKRIAIYWMVRNSPYTFKEISLLTGMSYSRVNNYYSYVSNKIKQGDEYYTKMCEDFNNA